MFKKIFDISKSDKFMIISTDFYGNFYVICAKNPGKKEKSKTDQW